jgi:hypothetical protein
VGTWKSEIKRLQKPLTGSTTWVPAVAKLKIQSLWQGDASFEELILDGANVHVDGVTLRLYDPLSKQCRIYWANRNGAPLGNPGIGGFKNGRGEFYDQEEFAGRMILVRQTYWDITKDSYRFEQAFWRLSVDEDLHVVLPDEVQATKLWISSRSHCRKASGSRKCRAGRRDSDARAKRRRSTLTGHLQVKFLEGSNCPMCRIGGARRRETRP